MSTTKFILMCVIGLTVAIVGYDVWYIVPEGHVGIEKQFGKATVQTNPGLQFKIPVIVRVERMEIRQRKSVEKLSGATQNQLPITASVSVNWSVMKVSAKQLFIDYGGLEQFENRIVDPRLRSSAKAAISMFPADQLIRNRQKVVAKIMEILVSTLEGFPVSINSAQLENFILPPRYMDAVLAKEQARENAIKEKHNLEKQRLVALQGVNTADASKQSKMKEADGSAYAVLTEAKAEAEAIEIITRQLARSPAYINLVKAKRWDGKLPVTMLSDSSNVLFSVGSKK